MDDGGPFVHDIAPPGVFDSIFQALDASSQPVIGAAKPRLLVIPLHDQGGSVVGGLWAHTLFDWLHIEMLVVPETRRFQGIGSALLATAETEARKRGCIGALVDTFSFQAAAFYRKNGFRQYADLDDCPRGHERLYLLKRFD